MTKSNKMNHVYSQFCCIHEHCDVRLVERHTDSKTTTSFKMNYSCKEVFLSYSSYFLPTPQGFRQRSNIKLGLSNLAFQPEATVLDQVSTLSKACYASR